MFTHFKSMKDLEFIKRIGLEKFQNIKKQAKIHSYYGLGCQR